MRKTTKKALSIGLSVGLVVAGVQAVDEPEVRAETISTSAQGVPAPPALSLELDPRILSAVSFGVIALIVTIVSAVMNKSGGNNSSGNSGGTATNPPTDERAYLANLRSDFISQLRAHRTANDFPGNKINPVKPIHYDDALNNYADGWSSTMARTQNYNHGPKIPGRVCQENLMMHYSAPTAEDLMIAWKNSPGHNQTMLTSEYKDIGLSTKFGNGAYYSTLIMCR